MEKVIYVFGLAHDGTGPDLGDEARDRLARTLLGLGAHAVSFNVVDHDVDPAAPLRILMSERHAGGLVSVWVDSATEHLRRPFDDALASAAGRADPPHAYLVTESVPLPNTRFPADRGTRLHGFAQVAFLRRPADQAEDEWLDIWLNDHTHVALDLQDTFSYVQNVVTRLLTEGAEPWDAIVEECFPPAAMTDPHAFFDTTDDELLARRQQDMYASVERFIDLGKIDVVPTSRYDAGGA